MNRSLQRLLLPALAGLSVGCRDVNNAEDQARANIATATTMAHEIAMSFDTMRIAARIPGLAVVVLQDTTVLFAGGYGVTDLQGGKAVTDATPFDIASVSKPISAVVALRLAQDGLLDLDRPMRSYRDFAAYCEDVRGVGGIFFGDYACRDSTLTMRHVLSMAANGEPGTRFWYNPPVYSWTSRPMMDVSGQPFSTLVDSLVFRPAGMTHSARKYRDLPLPADIAAQLAQPHGIDSTNTMVRVDSPPPQGDGAAGGVVASARDLARFDIALEQGILLAPAFRTQLFQGTITATGAVLPYGLGWFLGSYNGTQLAWHTGLWEGRYSALYLKVLSDDPAGRYTLILLANSDGLTWPTNFDEAAIERSIFATRFLDRLVSQRRMQ